MLAPAAALDRAAAVLRAGRSPVVLVDGRSGAGKSTFASALAERCGGALLRLEDVYPGWDGLDRGAEAASAALVARRAGRAATVASWDWAAARPGGRIRLPAAGPLIVEGCGAVRRASTAVADLAIWLELDAGRRRTRALARDGEQFRPYWEAWALEERLAIARDDPRRLADLLVDARTIVQPSFGGHSVPCPA